MIGPSIKWVYRDMNSMHNLRLVVVLMLAANAALLAFLCVPDLMNANIIGFRGHYEDTQFRVTTVYDESPADAAGLRSGDIITGQDGRDVAAWYAEYESDVDGYVARRTAFTDRISYDVSHAGRTRIFHVTPRRLGLADTFRLYGIRLLVIVLLGAMTIIILASKTRERAAFLIMFTFSSACIWLVADIPDWPDFFDPIIPGAPAALIYPKKMLEILFLQLAVAATLHVALVFPGRHVLLQRHHWLLPVNYAVPFLILTAVVLITNGGMMHRLNAAHAPRLWVNTMVMVVAAAIMLNSYRRLDSPREREQIRWIVASLVLFLGFHISMWNLPKLLIGHPIVPGYDWVLLPGILIPVTMTMSIINHELFGIRAIIRSRIMLLETLLTREKSIVSSRDQRILDMTRELEELNNALEQYRRSELGDSTGPKTSLLSRLEERYPEIADIRRDRLLGRSPKWEGIFERAVVAARGITPVMVVGESGTGKTELAWTVHRLSDRKDKVHKAISCAQFEHSDPAFALGRLFGIGTGHGLPNAPKEGRKGLLEECDGGTLFLDDFDRLPLSVQDMLLYPLEGRPFEPGIGVGPAREVSIKFILATNRDPDQLVREGSFRGDVLSRIGERLDIPPLRERPEDIPVLVQYFLESICRELGHEITIVSPMAMNLLSAFPYSSGNARELQMEIRAAAGKAMLEEDKILRAGYLSDRLRAKSAHPVERVPIPGAGRASEAPAETTVILEVLRKHQFQVKAAEAELGYSHKSKTLSNYLRGLCIEALSRHEWDAGSASSSLAGNGQSTITAKLQRKMERYTKNVENNVVQHTESRLYRNLPASFHDAMGKMIDHLRRAKSA